MTHWFRVKLVASLLGEFSVVGMTVASTVQSARVQQQIEDKYRNGQKIRCKSSSRDLERIRSSTRETSSKKENVSVEKVI